MKVKASAIKILVMSLCVFNFPPLQSPNFRLYFSPLRAKCILKWHFPPTFSCNVRSDSAPSDRINKVLKNNQLKSTWKSSGSRCGLSWKKGRNLSEIGKSNPGKTEEAGAVHFRLSGKKGRRFLSLVFGLDGEPEDRIADPQLVIVF